MCVQCATARRAKSKKKNILPSPLGHWHATLRIRHVVQRGCEAVCVRVCTHISLFKYAWLPKLPPAISRGSKSHVRKRGEKKERGQRKIENFCADIFRLSAGKFNGKRRVSKSTLATPTQWRGKLTDSGIKGRHDWQICWNINFIELN